MGLQPINIVLIGMVSLSALSVMVYWWARTRGSWWLWPAGRSVMALLGIIAVITANAFIHAIFKIPVEIKTITYSVLYVMMLSTMGLIGCTIRAEMARGDDAAGPEQSGQPAVDPDLTTRSKP